VSNCRNVRNRDGVPTYGLQQNARWQIGAAKLQLYAARPKGKSMTVCILSFPPSPDTTSKRNTHESFLRYMLVNDANPKTHAYCAQCGTKIGQQYVRETGSRSVFCDFACYRCVVEKWAPCPGGSEERKFVCGEPTSR
jgi:hypothetical protein